MRKHAKKSLLIPILALFSVIAIIAGCYMVQAITAHADDEAAEAAAIEASEVDAPAPGAEDPVTLGEAEPNPAPATHSMTARIHFSNGAFFSGATYSNISDGIGHRNGEDFVSVFGETSVTFDNVIDIQSITRPTRASQKDNVVSICGGGNEGLPVAPFVDIDLESYFYTLSSVEINYDGSEYVADVNIIVVPKYYIAFNANGGTFLDHGVDQGSIQGVAQGEYNCVVLPTHVVGPNRSSEWEPYREGYVFTGWYTDPGFGEKVLPYDSQVPAGGETFMLYAHGADEDETCNFHFTSADFGLFKYELVDYKYGEYDDNGTVFSYDIPKEIRPSVNWDKYEGDGDSDVEYGLYYHEDYESIVFELDWGTYIDNIWCEFDLFIIPLSGQRIDSVTFNGALIDCDYWYDYDTGGSSFNNIVFTTSGATPGYISVASNNGQLFECEIHDYTTGGENRKFVTDFLPIFLEPYDFVWYAYGTTNQEEAYFNASSDDLNNGNAGFVICICNKDGDYRYYYFRGNFASLFDVFNFNTYILGVNVDGNPLPVSNYGYHQSIDYHTFELVMTDRPADTTVTYNANGGKFADDSDTMTLDARFGEPLPLVETPKAIDNDFVGWFTEPEGGVQVDPEHFIWMPWQRETGVTLYAHWAYNPQPVPPEPVPPTPPEPVNPDVPGGGGTAQTGDSMPLVPIAALAVIAALGCGLAIRKEF